MLNTEELKLYFYIRCLGKAKWIQNGEFLEIMGIDEKGCGLEYSDELIDILSKEGLLI